MPITVILPPVSIIDRGYKDISNFVTDKRYKKGDLKGQKYKLESTQTIPVAGKLMYWWFGRGAQKQHYKAGAKAKSNTQYTPVKRTIKRKTTRSSSTRKPVRRKPVK